MSLPRKSGSLRLGAFGVAGEEHFLQAHVGPVLVGHLDADGVLAGDRRDDADARHAQIQGEVVGEVRDLVDAQAGLQGDLVLRDDRPGVDADDVDVEAEVGEGLFQQGGPFAQLLVLLGVRERGRVVEQRQRRQLVVVLAARDRIDWRRHALTAGAGEPGA